MMYICRIWYECLLSGKHIFDRKFFMRRKDAEEYGRMHATYGYADECGIDAEIEIVGYDISAI